MPFSSLPAPLQAALAAREYLSATPVQASVLEAPSERDLLVSAKTGSGKTVAYGLAMSANLMPEGAERLPQAGAPLALIVAPTRELALQVKTELAWLYAQAGGRVASCVGGMDPMMERRALNQGVHIVVGTPGRLRDHIERGNLNTQSLKVVVLDEADEMLDLGFRDELEAILDAVPAERRTLLFSATVPKPIAQLAKSYQRDAQRIEVSSQGEAHGDITYQATIVAPHDIERAVVNALRLQNPALAMVFCATRATVARLHGNLMERGFSAVALSGEMSQAERTRALQNLRDGRARVCVATDVAARGIDLPELALVIHADLPRDPETLQHRSGRTGRAGRKGTSLFIVPISRRRVAERLIQAARVQATWIPAPTAEAVRARDNERIVEQAKLLAAEEIDEADTALAATLDAPREALAAALIKLLRGPLPAPEELADTGSRERLLPTIREAPRVETDGAVWFHMDVGREGGADPKWLLPFICRRGHVTREEIGRIRILQGETQFEVAAAAAHRFAQASARGEGPDAHIQVEPMQPLPKAAPRADAGPGFVPRGKPPVRKPVRYPAERK